MTTRILSASHAQRGATLALPGRLILGVLFLVALLGFEAFNFDTTEYALTDLLGTASFADLRWATVLAIAFCAIDFAGLLRFFLPESDGDGTPSEVWYLMGAWLLGATMNALMTWWAVSLALLDHDLGNEILTRAQLLEIVPVFVAVLVWLTRIFFIGAFTVAGGYFFRAKGRPAVASPRRAREERPGLPEAVPAVLRRRPATSRLPGIRPVTDELPPFLRTPDSARVREPGDTDLAASSEERTAQPATASAWARRQTASVESDG